MIVTKLKLKLTHDWIQSGGYRNPWFMKHCLFSCREWCQWPQNGCFLRARYSSKSFTFSYPIHSVPQLYVAVVGAISIPISRIRKLRLRTAKQCAQNHTWEVKTSIAHRTLPCSPSRHTGGWRFLSPLGRDLEALLHVGCRQKWPLSFPVTASPRRLSQCSFPSSSNCRSTVSPGGAIREGSLAHSAPSQGSAPRLGFSRDRTKPVLSTNSETCAGLWLQHSLTNPGQHTCHTVLPGLRPQKTRTIMTLTQRGGEN